MTMQFPHPDDERLAALAEHDPEALADASLGAHLSACDRCSTLVAELAALRLALADLPDLAPSRRLRLVPPVREARRAGGFARRLFAPALAAGLLLSLAGGIGSFVTYQWGGMASSAGAPAQMAVPSTLGADRTAFKGETPGPSGTAERLAAPESQSTGGNPPWWPGVLGAGLVLLGTALTLRYVVEPRAG